MSNRSTILLIFACYMLGMVGVGVYFYRRNKNISDYILGGRSLNPWVAAMSAQASDMSGWLLTGVPGLAFISLAGTKEAVWTTIGLAIGTYLNWLFVARRLRAYSEVAGNAITIPQFFSNRFCDKKGRLKIICALFILLFFLIYTASMFVAGAKLFSTIFGIPYLTALLIGGVIIVVYTTLGGFMAVSWTDTFNGILMFIALVSVPCMLLFGTHLDPEASRVALRGFVELSPGEGFPGLVIASSLAWGLGYFGQPHILPRFMAINKASAVRPARVIAMVWVLISMAGALAVGMLGRVYFSGGLADSETVFMQLVQTLFSPVVAGVLLSAILAAIMSTADSQLLVTASAFSNDIYYQYKPGASQTRLVWVSRATVLVVSAAALLLASNPNSSVFRLVSFAWGGFGAAFGPAILFSLFWRRMTLPAAYAGIVMGGLSSVVFYFLKLQSGGQGLLAVYELLPAFVISAAVIVAVSLATPQPEEQVTALFDAALAHKD